MARSLDIILFVLCLAMFTPTLNANKLENNEYWNEQRPEFDSYWQERAKVAKQENKAAYFKDPYAISGNFTASISE